MKKRISKEEYKEKIGLMWIWFEKVLRKTRIRFLRIDNKIIFLLGKLREKNIETETDKSEKDSSVNEYKNANEEKIKEKETPKIEDNAGWQEKSVYVEDRSSENEVSKEMDSDKTAEIISEDKKSDDASKLETNVEEKTEAYAKKENAKGKEKEYIEMILKNPIDIKSYWKLGIVYSRRNNYKDALSCFRQITKIDPTYTKAKKKISDLVERMKNKKENKKKVKKEKETIKEDDKDQKKEG